MATTTITRGTKVELFWETLSDEHVLTGAVEDGDGSGYSVRLDEPTPFAPGREPREVLYVRSSGPCRLLLRVLEVA